MAPRRGAQKFDTLKLAKKFEIRPMMKHVVGRKSLTMTSDCGAKRFDRRIRQCRIRGPARIPTPFQNRPTKKSKCRPARVPPASREEPGNPRTHSTTDRARYRTHQEFDQQFDRKYQQHRKQFDRECRQQFDRKFIQNFDRRFLQDANRKSIQDPDRKFDADPTEKFDQSNLNQFA